MRCGWARAGARRNRWDLETDARRAVDWPVDGAGKPMDGAGGDAGSCGSAIILANYCIESVFAAGGWALLGCGRSEKRMRGHTHRGGGRMTFSGEAMWTFISFATIV